MEHLYSIKPPVWMKNPRGFGEGENVNTPDGVAGYEVDGHGRIKVLDHASAYDFGKEMRTAEEAKAEVEKCYYESVRRWLIQMKIEVVPSSK